MSERMRYLLSAGVVLIALVSAFTLGVSVGQAPAVAHAQASTPTLECVNSGDCGQYVVQINTQRGFAGVQIYQVQDQTHLVDTTQLQWVTSGATGASAQVFEPGTKSTQTITITAQEP